MLEKKGRSKAKESAELKQRTTHSTQLVQTLEGKVVALTKAVNQNASDIKTIKSKQSAQQASLSELLKENEKIKLNTSQKIKKIEKKYQDERARKKEKRDDS